MVSLVLADLAFRFAEESEFRVMDSLHLALVVHAVYFYAVTNFTNVFMLDVPTWCVSVDFCPSVISHS